LPACTTSASFDKRQPSSAIVAKMRAPSSEPLAIEGIEIRNLDPDRLAAMADGTDERKQIRSVGSRAQGKRWDQRQQAESE